MRKQDKDVNARHKRIEKQLWVKLNNRSKVSPPLALYSYPFFL